MIATKSTTQASYWKVLGIEGLLIMVSVFMGMWLQAWYENRSHEAVAERALEGVFAQAIENCRTILSIREYYQQVAAGERSPEGLRIGNLRTEAWAFLIASESLVQIDYPVARTATAIQNEQEFYLGLVDAYTQALFNLVISDPTLMKEWRHPEAERMVIADLLRSQDRLLEHYVRLIELIGDRDDYQHIETDRCLQAGKGDS
ncbi:MAG: hypothetical protein WD397_13260 [Wenzhouxiangellaceae bacterium]